jgi:glutathionylspermidine synthase
MKFIKLNTPPTAQLQQVGWDWALGQDTLPYIADQTIEVTSQQAEAYFNATNELYEMYIAAGQHVIDHHKFAELGIPDNLIELIKLSWEDDRNIHLYGRFDLSGGLDNKPIKLIEFNADTATCLPETAIVQWASLKANGMNDQSQFNTLYESLIEQFGLLRTLYPDVPPTLLISTMRDNPEDDTNVSVLGEAAKEAGFEVAFEYIDDVDFSENEGIFVRQNEQDFLQYHFWFKLVPWEFIAWDEPQLAQTLTKIAQAQKAIILNPAYTLLFQSKGILKILWELFEGHPLLLETKASPIKGKKCVQKVLFGREGANIKILNPDQSIDTAVDGQYQEQTSIYQEYTDFLKDEHGHCYQAGVFFAGEAAALGYRKGGQIIDNKAQFVGHVCRD